MTYDDKVDLCEREAWEQTQRELGPLPEAGTDECDKWFRHRDELFNSLHSELLGCETHEEYLGAIAEGHFRRRLEGL